MTVEQIQQRLDAARARLEAATAASDHANLRATANTVPEMAAVSGIRRKPNYKADDRRFNSYTRAAVAQTTLENLRDGVRHLELALARAIAERDRMRFTAADLAGATLVRDEFGWHRVVRINQKTVSVATKYSWNDLIPIDRILQFHVGENPT